MNRRTISFITTASLLSGCATTSQQVPQPIVITKDVMIPVASPCVPAALGAAPVYPDDDASLRAAKDAAERYQLVGAGRKLRTARLNELEPIVAGCSKAPK